MGKINNEVKPININCFKIDDESKSLKKTVQPDENPKLVEIKVMPNKIPIKNKIVLLNPYSKNVIESINIIETAESRAKLEFCLIFFKYIVQLYIFNN